MKQALDKFSKQSTVYKKFRPTYPVELFEYLYSQCSAKNVAWDCGTGNGQVAAVLAHTFDQVWATDISEKQIQNAEEKSNIAYFIARAEQTNFPDKSVDLVTVGQALHWFDIPRFFAEAKRVLKSGGIIAVWGYSLLRINSAINELVNDFYRNETGPYWDFERKYVDSNYTTLDFDFEEVEVPGEFNITTQWTLTQLEGYLNSWSAVQNYKEQNQGKNPVPQLIAQIACLWKAEVQNVTFPIFIRLGRNR